MEPYSCNAGALLCHSRACELQEPSSEPSAQGNARAQRVTNTKTPKGLRTRAREATLHAYVVSPGALSRVHLSLGILWKPRQCDFSWNLPEYVGSPMKSCTAGPLAPGPNIHMSQKYRFLPTSFNIFQADRREMVENCQGLSTSLKQLGEFYPGRFPLDCLKDVERRWQISGIFRLPA